MSSRTSSPSHVGIIMDGNGRWAKKRGMPRPMGHRAGVKAVRIAIDTADELGLSFLTLYVFSTENFNRPEGEVSLLMKLFIEMMKKELNELNEKGVRVIPLGLLSKLPSSVQKTLSEAQEKTKNNSGLTLQLAFGYGGREEIVEGVKRAILSGVSPDEIDEKSFSSLLYNPETPDPELIIRTGGTQRLSNFLLWQSAYAELYFTKTLWPDFTRKELLSAIAEYHRRERRFGKVTDES